MVPGQMVYAATLGVRQAPGATFASYALTHATLHPASRRYDAPPALGQQTLSVVVWQDDLDAAGAPAPKVSDRIVFASPAVTYLIEGVDSHLIDSAWFCSMRKAR